MDESFNPYQKWLGIPTDQQPPNPYRLLGVELFESDGETIHHAADRQMAHVRTFQSGQYQDLCQKLLNEIAAARVLLLDPQQRSAVDDQLRSAASQPSAPAIVPVAADSEQSVASRLKKKQKKQPGNRTMDVVKIVAGSLGGLALAIVILLLIGVDPFGITKKPEPKEVEQGKEVVQQTTPKKNKKKEKLEALEPSPFHATSAPTPLDSNDPFQLRITDMPSEGPPNPTTKTQAGSSGIGLKQEYDEPQVQQTVTLLQQAVDNIRKLTDANSRLENSDRSQLADTVRESFCRVAHVVAHSKTAALKPEVVRAMNDGFVKLSGHPPSANLLGDLASFCLAGDEQSNDGVVLIGSLKNIRPVGSLFEAEIELSGNAQSVYAISKDGGRKVGERLVILGAIVNDPKQNLGGYEGDRDQVVWNGLIVGLTN